jgi:glucan-binding YG repeat protein
MSGLAASKTTKLAQPKLSSVSANDEGIKVKWKKVTNAEKYIIYRKNAGSSKWKKLASTTSSSYLDTKVGQGKSYVYTVAAVADDNKSTYDERGTYCVFSQSEPYLYAMKIVNQETTASMTNLEKLRACYNWYKKKKTGYRTNSENPLKLSGNSWITRYATELFENNRGNCYRHASSFAYIASVLGYEPKIVVGKVQASAGGMTPHGWVEITMKGTKYIFDERLQFAQEAKGIKVNMFKVKYSGSPKYPLKISPTKRYTLPESNRKGLVKEEDGYCYYKNGEAQKKLWKTIDGNKYYFKSDGYAAVGSYKINGKYYIFNEKGQLFKPDENSLLWVGEDLYYVNKKGNPVTGWQVIDEKVYYVAKDGKCAVNTTVEGIKFSKKGYATNTEKAMSKIEAKAFIAKHTKTSMSQKKNLKSVSAIL